MWGRHIKIIFWESHNVQLLVDLLGTFLSYAYLCSIRLLPSTKQHPFLILVDFELS